VLRKATRLAVQINMQAPETLEDFSSVEAMRWRRYDAVTEGPAVVGDTPGLNKVVFRRRCLEVVEMTPKIGEAATSHDSNLRFPVRFSDIGCAPS